MPRENLLRNNFSGGELSPTMEGRSDLQVHNTGLRVLENCFITKTSGARKRLGWETVVQVLPAALNVDEARLIGMVRPRGEYSLLLFGHQLAGDDRQPVVAFQEFPVNADGSITTRNRALKNITSITGPAPPIPTGLVCRAGNEFIMLTWTAVPGATDYDYRFRRQGDMLWSEVLDADDIPEPSFTIRSLDNEREYEFEVRARNDQGASDWSATATCAATLLAPETPTGLIVTAPSEGGLRVAWVMVDGASEYRIRVRPTGDNTPTWNEAHEHQWVPLATSRRLNNVLAGIRYEVQVQARNVLESPWTESVFGTPASTTRTAPEVPMNLMAELIGSGRVRLEWEGVDGAERFMYRYRVGNAPWVEQAAGGDGPVAPQKGETGTTEVRGLKGASRIVFQIKAVRGETESGWSLQAVVSTLKPGTPTNLRVNNIGLTRNITWTAVAEADEYEVQREVRNGFPFYNWASRITIHRGPEPSATDFIPESFFSGEIDARYRVRAMNEAGTSRFTGWVNDPRGAVP